MALTNKPVATISYNSEGYLKRVLDGLFNAGTLEDYRYIFHQGEDGDKDHFHVIMYPNRRIDTVSLRETFKEVPPNGDTEHPLGCMVVRISKPDHWLMYALHDPLYLQAHSSDNDGDGKIEYQLDDVKTPFPEQLQRDFKTALKLRRTDNQKIIEGIQSGTGLSKLAYEENFNPMRIGALVNLMRLDGQFSTLNQAMLERMKQLEVENTKLLESNQTLALENLELRTGEDLHTKEKESVFDEDFNSKV